MKTALRIAVVVVLLFSVTTNQMSAQSNGVKFENPKIQKILDNVFTPAIESDIPGIVEGSIYNVVLCKKYYSTLNYSKVTETLTRLVKENKSTTSSYKAHLALLYLANASNITITPVPNPDSQDYLFKQISKELETKLLAANALLTKE